MNHRDRNVHNAGFTMGGYAKGYKPKATINGVKLTVWVITITAGMCFIGKMFGLV